MSSDAQPIDAAAIELGIAPGTLRRWIREGCPVVQHGRRGRGGAVLVNADQVRRWREAADGSAPILELASALPDVLAKAIDESFREFSGPSKRTLAGPMALSWYVATTAVLDLLRERCPAVQHACAVPSVIERLRQISRE